MKKTKRYRSPMIVAIELSEVAYLPGLSQMKAIDTMNLGKYNHLSQGGWR